MKSSFDYVYIFHDPFSRSSLVRRVIHVNSEIDELCCDNCGGLRHEHLFQYGTLEDDDLSGRPSWDNKYFCSLGCRNSYYF